MVFKIFTRKRNNTTRLREMCPSESEWESVRERAAVAAVGSRMTDGRERRRTDTYWNARTSGSKRCRGNGHDDDDAARAYTSQ